VLASFLRPTTLNLARKLNMELTLDLQSFYQVFFPIMVAWLKEWKEIKTKK